MPCYLSTDLDTARKTVAMSERHIIQQELRLTRLRMAGCPTARAEFALAELNRLLIGPRISRSRSAMAPGASKTEPPGVMLGFLLRLCPPPPLRLFGYLTKHPIL